MNNIGKSQIFFWLLISFLVGVAIASFLATNTAAVAAVFVLGASILIFGSFRGATSRSAVTGWCLVVVAGGIFWFLWHGQGSRAALPVGRRTVEGVVVDEPRRSGRSQQLVVRAETGAKVLVTLRPYPEYRYGDRLRFVGEINRAENFSPDFDYAAFLAKDDIFVVMPFPEVTSLEPGAGSTFLGVLLTAKRFFLERINAVLPEPHAALLGGILLGARESLPAELRDDLRRTGTIHIVAVSGYNVTLVADAFLRALAFLALPFAAAFWVAVGAIATFALLTGASASVVRASLMAGLVLVARREHRPYRMRNAIMLAAALMVAVNPKILRFDIGFQLSFLATLGIIYGAPMVDSFLERARLRCIPPLRALGIVRPSPDRPVRKPRRSFLRETVTTTISAQLFVLPLLIWHFGEASLVGPFANVLIIPVIPAAMLFGLLAGLGASAAALLGQALAPPAWLLLAYVIAVIETTAALPLAAIPLGHAARIVAVMLALILVVAVLRYYRHAVRSALRRSGHRESLHVPGAVRRPDGTEAGGARQE